MPTIGLDIQALTQVRTGLGTFVAAFSESLNGALSAEFNLQLFSSRKNAGKNLNTLQRLCWENVELPGLIDQMKPDILHVPAFALPLRKQCPAILTVHDLIGIKFENQKGLPSRFYWKKWLPSGIRRADRIVAISEHTKKDLIETLGVPERKIRVIYPSGHENFSFNITQSEIDVVKTRLGISGPYFMTVGSFEPRKNLEKVLEAFGRFTASGGENCVLVLVGPHDFAGGDYFRSLCAKFKIGSNQIIATGYVNHDTLNALYAGSRALIFASLYEGFGLPLLEAMASGCPVIASNRTCLPEIAGNAAEWVNPDDAADIAGAVNRLHGDEKRRDELKARGFERIRFFSWKRHAQEVCLLYREVLGL